MSTLKNQINDDVKSAMRNRDKIRLLTLRMITAGIKQREVDERIELDDAQVLAVLDKMAKQHRDSIEQYNNAGRDDLAEKERTELAVVENYMPTPLNDEEIVQLIKDAIDHSGAESMKDMGKVMGILKPQLQGRADMGNVSSQVKQQLA